MTTDLATFDITNAADLLRDKVKLAFVEMLTDDQWSTLIAQEWERFVSGRKDHGRYATSDLSKICQTVLKEIATKRIREELAGPKWKAGWGEVSEQVEKLVLNNRGAFVEALLKSMMGTAIQQILQQFEMQLQQ